MSTKTSSPVKNFVYLCAVVAGIILVANMMGGGDPDPDRAGDVKKRYEQKKPDTCTTNDLQECILLEVRFEPPLRKPRDVHVVASVEGVDVYNEWPVSSIWARYHNVPKGARVILQAFQFSGEFMKCLIIVNGYVKSEDAMDGVNESGVNCVYMAS